MEGGDASSDDEAAAAPAPQSYNAEQEELRQAFLQASFGHRGLTLTAREKHANELHHGPMPHGQCSHGRRAVSLAGLLQPLFPWGLTAAAAEEE